MPSLWREAYGLVALAASILGVPVLSTDHGGLAEANPLAELCVPSLLVADGRTQRIHRGITLEAFEAAPDAFAASGSAAAEARGDTHSSGGPGGVSKSQLEPYLEGGFLEGGWHGPAPADVAPVPRMREELEHLVREPGYLRRMSTQACCRSRKLVTSRQFGLSYTLLRNLVEAEHRG